MVNLSDSKPIVLVVDDSPETLGMLNQALESAGMTTLVALEGQQAISIAQKMTPDIILLDAIMPKMDGFEACTKIKGDANLNHIPVIFMTGLSDTESVVKGFEAGGVDYLTKPINPQELIARMNVHLMNARTANSAQQALDSTGQNVFAVTTEAKKIWATPQVEKLLTQISNACLLDDFMNQFETWLNHKPKEGNKFPFNHEGIHITAVYIGLSANGENLIRLINDEARDEKSILKESFNITRRESEVFLWLAKGKTNREIAIILEMSPRTVNKHLEQLFKKLDVDNRTTAAGLAIQCLQAS